MSTQKYHPAEAWASWRVQEFGILTDKIDSVFQLAIFGKTLNSKMIYYFVVQEGLSTQTSKASVDSLSQYFKKK